MQRMLLNNFQTVGGLQASTPSPLKSLENPASKQCACLDQTLYLHPVKQSFEEPPSSSELFL
jgi:hypothetical protein